MKPVKTEFLKTIEDKMKPGDNKQIENLNQLRNKVLEKVKISKKSRERSSSVSSVSSNSSTKRKSEKSPERSVRAKPGSGIPLKS